MNTQERGGTGVSSCCGLGRAVVVGDSRKGHHEFSAVAELSEQVSAQGSYGWLGVELATVGCVREQCYGARCRAFASYHTHDFGANSGHALANRGSARLPQRQRERTSGIEHPAA